MSQELMLDSVPNGWNRTDLPGIPVTVAYSRLGDSRCHATKRKKEALSSADSISYLGELVVR